MSWKSGGRRYGAVAMAMHWVTAIAAFAMLASGLTMADMADDAARQAIMRVHVVMGVAVVLLTVLRIAWWVFADRRPEDAEPQSQWQAWAAWLVHRLFYLVIILMGTSGLATIAISGAGTILFGGAPGPLPDLDVYAPRIAHGLFAWVLMALIAVHIAAALYHQIVLRDRLLGRMGLGRAA